MGRFASIVILCIWLSNVYGHSFKGHSYAQIAERLLVLAERFPHWATLTTAQEKYGLPSSGKCGKSSCKQWILTLTHRPSLAQEQDSRPRVFFSGELHGNERVGPVATMEAAHLLLSAADCVEKNLLAGEPLGTICASMGESEINALRATLDTSLSHEEIDQLMKKRMWWMYRLVTTRVIVMTPMTNAIGYFRNVRDENGIDTNRDFPFDQDPKKCMQSITALTLNEVFRENLFQLAITFHGGMQAIAYEWGTRIHPASGHHDISPDDYSQAKLSASMSRFGGSGKYSSNRKYPHKPMNSLVYPVHGGMEDWAYAASWDRKYRIDPVQPCVAKHGVSSKKFEYSSSMLRVINLLVETSDMKNPPDNALGTIEGVFLPLASDSQGNGHISRNIRLILETIDMVEPYIEWDHTMTTVRFHPSLGQIVPTPGGWLETGSITNNLQSGVEIRWKVGGSINVDSTSLEWGCAPLQDLSPFRFDPLKFDKGIGSLIKGSLSAPKTGPGLWSGLWEGERFSHVLYSVPRCDVGSPFLIVAATVDQSFGDTPEGVQPTDTPPQSHFANARTNVHWIHTLNNQVLVGHKVWYSSPIFVLDQKSASPGLRHGGW